MTPSSDKQNDSTSHDGIEGIPTPTGKSGLIDTDYVIGQDNYTGRLVFDVDLHGKVFGIAALVIVLFVVLTLALQDEVEPLFTGTRDWLTGHLSWFFLATADVFMVLCVVLIFTPLGKVRLGGMDARPDHTYLGWFAMLFAAGMGIGLMFYGVAEPITHYTAAMGGVTVGDNGVRTDSAPLGGAEGNASAAAYLGMSATIMHYALHPWAMYATVALALALFSFNKGLPLTMRSIFYPILGERVWGWPGHVIDILAVFSTLFGLATSLGFGARQATAGLHFLFNIPDNRITMVLLVVAITAVALCSVVAGLDNGVRRLSELNMGLALLLLLFVLCVGPTLTLFKEIFINLGNYFKELPAFSNPFGREDVGFSQDWTAFYWSWWISWSPFVGMFIARVSRGRTVREFLIAVLLVPTCVGVIWMTVFGGTAIAQLTGGAQQIADAALELKLFVMLEQLPLTMITSFVGIVLVAVFFITSSDSGSLVIDAITAGGKTNAPTTQRVFWAIIEGVIAIALLLGGGLAALQAMVVSTGLPFALLLLVGCYAIIQGLCSELRIVNAATASARRHG